MERKLKSAKTTQRYLCKKWKEDGNSEMIEYINDRFGHMMHGRIRDEFEELAVPWPTGYIFDRNTSEEEMEFLNKLCHTKNIVVFGVCSNLLSEFDEYDSVYTTGLNLITDAPNNVHIYYPASFNPKKKVDYVGNGFWPAGPCQAGHLPMMIFYKAFRYENMRKDTPYAKN